MSRFYGDLKGSRGVATRQGTAKSGIDGHLRGWKTGARVIVDTSPHNGKDRVRVFRTGGSSAQAPTELIAEWEDGDKAPSFYK